MPQTGSLFKKQSVHQAGTVRPAFLRVWVCVRKCVCTVVTICVMRMGTHLSKTVNEFCQCLRISINQGEQWPVGLGAVRDGLLATRQKETLQAERHLHFPWLSDSWSLYLSKCLKWSVKMKLKMTLFTFLMHIFLLHCSCHSACYSKERKKNSLKYFIWNCEWLLWTMGDREVKKVEIHRYKGLGVPPKMYE